MRVFLSTVISIVWQAGFRPDFSSRTITDIEFFKQRIIVEVKKKLNEENISDVFP